MIDFILFFFTAGVAYGGFWLGAKFKTIPALWASIKTKIGIPPSKV